MTSTSDPAIGVREKAAWSYGPGTRADLAKVARPRPPMQRILAYGSLVAVTTVVALSTLASMLATPLDSPGSSPAPTWSVEMTTTGDRAVTALVYGREAGIHLVRVPAATAASSVARVIPARLAKGELHMVSLGLSTLRVRTASPAAVPRMSFMAESRVITAFQSRAGTGVRTWW
jgi:hypothetical protein